MLNYGQNIQQVRDEIGTEPDTNTIVKVKQEKVKIVEGPTVTKTIDIGSTFYLNHATNGLLADSGTINYLYDDRQTPVIETVTNPYQRYIERFVTTNFKDTTYTTADWNTTTNTLDFTAGEIAQTSSIFYNGQDIISATPKCTEVSGTLNYYLSRDGGVNWFDTTNNTKNLFNISDFNLFYSQIDSGIAAWWKLYGDATDSGPQSIDGTLSTPTVIEAMTDTTNFLAVTECQFSQNSTTWQVGSNSVNVYSTASPTQNNMGFDVNWGVPTDLSYVGMNFYFYIKDQTTMDKLSSQSITIYFYSATDDLGGAVGWDKYYVYKTDLTIGWNVINCKIGEPDGIESDGADDTIIEKMRLRINKSNTSDAFAEGDLIVNYLTYGIPYLTKGRNGTDNTAYALNGTARYDAGEAGTVGSYEYISFDGTNLDYDYTKDFSFGLWFYRTDNNYSLNATGLFGVPSYKLGMHIQNTDDFVVGTRNGGGETTDQVVKYGITNDEWHLAVGTYDSSDGTLSLYFDGDFVDSVTVDNNFDTGAGSWNIGRTVVGGNIDNFRGKVENARVYNSVLNANQVKLWYDSGASPVSGQDLRLKVVETGASTAQISEIKVEYEI